MMIRLTSQGLALILISLMLLACGTSVKETELTVSGRVTFGNLDPQDLGPVFVAILDQNPMAEDGSSMEDSIVAIKTIIKDDPQFSFTLSSRVVRPGDQVFLMAFADNDFHDGMPDPGLGDMIGYYVDTQKMTPAYVLQDGDNSGLTIAVTKEMFDFEASLSGRVLGDMPGKVTVVALAGEITSMDMTQIDFYNVVGYTQFTKGTEPVSFSFDIFPYGFDVPIADVYLIALLDSDADDHMGQGDFMGYYTGGGSFPMIVTIDAGHASGYDITPDTPLSDPSGDTLTIGGTIEVPEDLEPVIGGLPLFVFAVKADEELDMAGLAAGDLQGISNFQKLPAGSRSFDIDLSMTGLGAGDKVILIAVCDLGYTAGFPDVGAGDIIGYFVNTTTMGPEITLVQGGNPDVSVTLSKEFFDYEASLSGTVSSEDNGALTVFAYAGDIASFDFAGGIDPEQVIAFQRIEKISPNAAFHLDILPFGYDLPVTNVFVVAWLDTDGSGGLPDAGDRIGFVAGSNGLPALLTVDGNDPGNLQVDMSMVLPQPSETQVTLSGQVDVPGDMAVGNQPICILVVRSGDSMDLTALVQGELSDLVWYQKLEPGQRSFECDLASRGLAPGDRVMVIAVCDRELTVGFPDLTPGDYLGFYQNNATMDVNFTLAAGENTVETTGDTSFSLSRVMYDHTAQVLFELEDNKLQAMSSPEALDPGETVTVAVVAEDGVVIAAGGESSIDMDYVIGYGSLTVPDTGNSGHLYSLDILPFIDRRITVQNPFSVANVYVFAIFDGNTSSTPDKNNYLGYYWRLNLLLMMVPDLVDQISDGSNVLDKTVRFSTNTF